MEQKPSERIKEIFDQLRYNDDKMEKVDISEYSSLAIISFLDEMYEKSKEIKGKSLGDGTVEITMRPKE